MTPIPPVLAVHRPDGAIGPVVLDSPHSGRQWPDDFATVVDREHLRSSEDVDVQVLYAMGPRHGAPLLEALFPRAYIDPNRAAGDVDLDLMDGPWPDAYTPSGKARIGKSLIWRCLDDGTPLYAGRLPVAAIQRRIRDYLVPYQTALKQLLDEAHAAHGRFVHINCHSMEAVGGAMAEGGGGKRRAEVVLGDRDGTTCDPALTARVAAFFRARGYEVAINDPFKGVELVRMYSDPSQGRHSMQIELSKAVYLRPGTRERNERFAQVQAHLGELVAELSAP